MKQSTTKTVINNLIILAALALFITVYAGAADILNKRMHLVRAQCASGELLCR